MIRKLGLGLLWCWLGLSGCASAPNGAKEPTNLSVQITVDKKVNLDSRLRSSPILVRVYELKNTSVFEQADFFSLFENDKTTLGEDLLSKTEFILKPGEEKQWQRASHPETTALGFIAGYQQLSQATWRAVKTLPAARDVSWYGFMLPSHSLKMILHVQEQGLNIEGKK